jgi:hypothetical protein
LGLAWRCERDSIIEHKTAPDFPAWSQAAR